MLKLDEAEDISKAIAKMIRAIGSSAWQIADDKYEDDRGRVERDSFGDLIWSISHPANRLALGSAPPRRGQRRIGIELDGCLSKTTLFFLLALASDALSPLNSGVAALSGQ